MNTTHHEKATRAELEHLWRAVLKLLNEKVQQRGASAEMLTAARRFLSDNNVSPADSPLVLKALAGLRDSYVEGLIAALSEPGPPSATLLQELRIFLEQASAQKADQLPEALSMTVPFKTIQ